MDCPGWTGRRMAGELADLAPRWFHTGATSRREVVERIEADGVDVFVSPRWFYLRDRFFRRYLAACYTKPRIYDRLAGSGLPRIFVFRHRECGRTSRAVDPRRTGGGSRRPRQILGPEAERTQARTRAGRWPRPARRTARAGRAGSCARGGRGVDGSWRPC